MKKLFLLLPLFALLGCFGSGDQTEVGLPEPNNNTDINYSTGEITGEASYNVNLYDGNDEWYETGLLIESFDSRVFIQIDNGRYELLPSDKDEYRYMAEIDGEMLYVK